MAHVLLHAQDQGLAVFLKDIFGFNHKRWGLVQQLLGDAPDLFSREVRVALQG